MQDAKQIILKANLETDDYASLEKQCMRYIGIKSVERYKTNYEIVDDGCSDPIGT